jgi:enoyl-CoA hydratase/carnithine racemase
MAEIVSLKREETADVTPEGGMLRITLNNPPANVLSLEVMRDIQAQLDRARDDASVRVVVIASEGKIFCAGHDLKQLNTRRADADAGRAYFEETFDTCTKLMLSIVRHPKPVIAEVGGLATAAGCQLVASCDLAIASDQATFGVNGINVGLFCTTPGVALVRGLKPKHAMEMLLTGEMVDAATAKEFGLVNRVVPAEYLQQVVAKYARTIASKPPATVTLGKQAFYRQAEMGLAEAYDHASRVMVENLLADDAREGMSAFVEKRKPVWKAE